MSYYRNLEFFFKKFEEKYNLEIIVAAHPRSDYKTNNLLAKERKFFINQTPELVKNSKIVLRTLLTQLISRFCLKNLSFF